MKTKKKRVIARKVNYNGEKGSGQCDRRFGKRPGPYRKMTSLPAPTPAPAVMPNSEQAALPEKVWEKKPVHEFKKIALVKFFTQGHLDHFTQCMKASPAMRNCPRDMVSNLLMVVPRMAIKYFDGPENKQFSTLPAGRGRQPKERPKAYEIIRVLFVPNIPSEVGEQIRLMHNLADHSKDLAAMPADNQLHIDEAKVKKTPYFQYRNEDGQECLLRNYVLEAVAHKAAYNIFLKREEALKEPSPSRERWFSDTAKVLRDG